MKKPRINVPFLTFEAIQAKVEEFVSQFSGGHSTIPVDVELMTEYAGLTIIPIDQLANDSGLDAVYMHALDAILVDKDEFVEAHHWPRLRFSMAHELGHFWLHKDLLKQISFKSEAEWIQYLAELDNYDQLEFQANEFAGRLMVPRYELIELIKQEKVKASEFALNAAALESILAIRLTRKFGVSEQVIAIRFQRENLLSLIHHK